MKLGPILAATSLVTPATFAIDLRPRTASPRVVGAEIERRQVHPNEVVARDRRRLGKRQSTVEQTLDNEESLYFANVTLGTPPQSLRLHLDTGSSDLWVNVPDSSLCESQTSQCQGGTYNSGGSSTYQLVSNDFNISYVDGTSAGGDYASDTLTFGGVTIRDFQFGIGEESSSQEGVLGIGYAINEVQVNRAGRDPYPNLPLALVDGGHIHSNAYSLWLNDLDASVGTILFGGVNAAKYQGELATMPVIQQSGNYYSLIVALTGLTLNGNKLSSSSLPAAVLLDSGSTLTYLPDDLVTDIYNDVEAVYSQSQGAAYATCTQASQDSTLDFEFSGQKISVPYNELFLDAGTDSFGNPLTFQDGQRACLFGIAPAQGGTAVLGDTFLRSAYVVYDLANNEISLAQTVFNSTNDDVREIGTGSGSVPGATPVANPVTNVAGAPTDGARLGGATGTATGLSDPFQTNDAEVVSRRGSAALGGLLAMAAMVFAAF